MEATGARQEKWLFSLSVSLCLLVLLLWPDALAEFRFDREALASGQWWRAITGHLVHLNTVHLLLNWLGLLLICDLLWRNLSLVCGWALLLFSAAGTSVQLWYFDPELAWYAGLSGALHGLWAGCALSNLWTEPVPAAEPDQITINTVPNSSMQVARYFSLAALAFLLVKLAMEMLYGRVTHTERLIGGAVIYQAHLYGAASGAAGFMLWRSASRWRARHG